MPSKKVTNILAEDTLITGSALLAAAATIVAGVIANPNIETRLLRDIGKDCKMHVSFKDKNNSTGLSVDLPTLLTIVLNDLKEASI